MSLSISRVLVVISSVLSALMSSGISSQVSITGASGVTSIAVPLSGFVEAAGVSAAFSLFEDGGSVGGGAEDIVESGEQGKVDKVLRHC